jgi:hypothetical protein
MSDEKQEAPAVGPHAQQGLAVSARDHGPEINLSVIDLG